MEQALRTYTPANELYIVAGGAGTGGTGSNGGVTTTIANGRITVPAFTWKVALVIPKGENDLSRVDCSSSTIAVIVPNANNTNPDWTTYLTTVDAVEVLTGYDFYSNLPEPIQRCVEAGINGANPPLDTDADTVPDSVDNCPIDSNSDQADFDSDGLGDACDPDNDNDGVADTEDAFPFDPTESVDTDGDGIGNNADTDDDGDGQSDADEIACGSNPLAAGSKAPDNDGDNSPDCVDPDDDNDGVLDGSDAFPFDPNESVDTDGDGIGNSADTDDDGDGQSDVNEIACGSDPLNAGSKSPDIDQDNIPDCVDSTRMPTSADQCKKDGWRSWTRNDGSLFKNQGDCIQFVNTGK